MQDRAEIVEAMARELLGRVNAPEQEIYRVAGDLADSALKAAAEIARGAHKSVSTYDENSPLYGSDLNPDRSDFGRGKQAGREEAYSAILALTSEGTKG